MKAIKVGLVSIGLILCLALSQQLQADVLIVGGKYFDIESGTFLANPGIHISDGRFEKVGQAVEANDDTEVIRLSDEFYILPGLIDCHAHYNVRLLGKRREEFTVMPVQYLANGVTVTFSCGEYDPERMLQLRKDIESGKQIGPRLLNSGPYFGRARPRWHGDPEQVRQEVDAWAEFGVGGFKAKVIDPECLKALVEQAHKHDLTVTGHLESGYRNTVNPRDAIDIGIDRIEHFLGGDAMTDDKSAYATLAGITPDMPEFKAIVKKFVDTGTYFDCTITAYGYSPDREKDHEIYGKWYDESSLFTDFVREKIKQKQAAQPPRPMTRFIRIYDRKRSTIDDYFRAGGLITTGTDHVSDGGFLPGFSIHREIAAIASSGIEPAEVLKMATINGAKAFGIEKDHGSIAVGKVADLAIVRGNPLEKIANTRNVKYVVRAGKVHESDELLESVKGKLGPTKDEELGDW